MESWLRKEREEDRKKKKERREKGLAEHTLVNGPRLMNNGWAGGRLHSTLAGEENFFFSSNAVLRQ